MFGLEREAFSINLGNGDSNVPVPFSVPKRGV